jgi:hypothetical protein
MATQGPFRPTTKVTYLVDCIQDTLVFTPLGDFDFTGWPQTVLVTNTGAAATYFSVQNQTVIDTWSPLAGTLLLPGDTMLYTVEPQATANNFLNAYTFGLGATTIAITGGTTT